MWEWTHNPTHWVAIAFLVFIGLIVWKARGAILDGLDARAERIKAELDEAQRLREEAQKTLAEYKRKQSEASKEAEELLEHTKLEAKRMRAQAEADLAAALKLLTER